MVQDLDFVADKVSAFFSVSGDGGAGHRQFCSDVQLDGGIDNGIESEDLLGAVGILGVSSDADSRIEIVGHFGTPEGEGISFRGIPQDNIREDSSLDDQIEARLLKFFLEAEYLVEDARFFRIGLAKAKGNDLYFGSFDFGIDREAPGGAFDLYTHFFEKRLPVRRVQAVEDPSADFIDNADEFDTVALFFEPGAALVSGIGGKEGPIGGDDLIGEKTEQFGNLHQDMKYPVVKILSQSHLEVGEGGFTGALFKADSGIKAVMPAPFPVPDYLHEGLHIRKLFDMPEEIQDKKANGIIGGSRYGVLMSDKGTDKGKIYQGGYKPCEPSFYSTVGVDADIPPFITVSR